MNDDENNLLELAATEERFYVEQHQKRVQFFVVFNSTLFGGCVLGFAKEVQGDPLALVIIPVLICIVSWYAKSGVRSLYIRMLEAIVFRAKVEQQLGFHLSNNASQSPAYWKDEPLINARHLRDRELWESSSKFIENASTKGYQKTVCNIFTVFQILAVVLVGVILWVSPWVQGALQGALRKL